jgi:hypothetical protein
LRSFLNASIKNRGCIAVVIRVQFKTFLKGHFVHLRYKGAPGPEKPGAKEEKKKVKVQLP